MNIKFSELKNLTPFELIDLLKLRQDVFCIEQRCLYPDIDLIDKTAIHALVFKDNSCIGVARIYNTKNAVHIGRIAIIQTARSEKNGKLLVQACIDYCQKNYPNYTIEISAQLHLLGYYRSLGFKESTTTYFEDGIPHIKMSIEKIDNSLASTHAKH